MDDRDKQREKERERERERVRERVMEIRAFPARLDDDVNDDDDR